MTAATERFLLECERSIKIDLAGPLAGQRMRAEIAAAKPDAEGWRRHFDPRLTTAVHEAAHVVVCVEMKEPFQRVSIRPLRNSAGRLIRGDKPAPPDHDAVQGETDQVQVVQRLRLLWLAVGSPGWKAMRTILRRLRAETSEILERRWVYVERLANRLLAQEELDRAEVEALLVGLRPEANGM